MLSLTLTQRVGVRECKNTHSEQSKLKNFLANPNRIKLEVLYLDTEITTIYDSIRAAGKALNITYSSINYNLKSLKQKPYKGRYVFKMV